MNPHARLIEAIGGLPDSYLVADVETNGLSVKDELVLPTQLGYLLAVDRKVEDYGAVVVDWSRVLPDHLKPVFWEKVRKVERDMAEKGLRCKVPAGRIVAEGEDPRDAWPAYRDMLATALGNGLKVCGHNIVSFDCPLLSRVGLQMEAALDFEPHQLLDFGLFEKAINAGLEFPDPAKGTIEQWYHYVKSAFARGKWSLHPHCVEKYGLDIPREIALTGAHDAAYDCVSSYLLVEAMRGIADGTRALDAGLLRDS